MVLVCHRVVVGGFLTGFLVVVGAVYAKIIRWSFFELTLKYVTYVSLRDILLLLANRKYSSVCSNVDHPRNIVCEALLRCTYSKRYSCWDLVDAVQVRRFLVDCRLLAL